MQLTGFLRSITNSVKRIIKNVQYRNLVFKGGGVRGIAYMGALEALEEYGILGHIERVAGSSAGAIAAMLLSFRLPVSETIEAFNSLDLAKVPYTNSSHLVTQKLPHIKNAENVRRLLEKFGWYSSSYFHEWVSDVIASQCGRNPRATFRDFHLRGYRDLHVVAANLSRKRSEVFSFETTPDIAVADAVRLSMSIPLFFEALQFDGSEFGKGDFYVDGGLFDNYPIHLFDQPKYAQMNPFYKNGINWETLGFFLKSEDQGNSEESLLPGNLFNFINLIVRSFYDAHDLSNLDKNLVDQKRSVVINDCGISAIRFDLEPEGELYRRLYDSGRDSTFRFLRSK